MHWTTTDEGQATMGKRGWASDDGRTSLVIPSDARISLVISKDAHISLVIPKDAHISLVIPKDTHISLVIPKDTHISRGISKDTMPVSRCTPTTNSRLHATTDEGKCVGMVEIVCDLARVLLDCFERRTEKGTTKTAAPQGGVDVRRWVWQKPEAEVEKRSEIELSHAGVTRLTTFG
ncbi:hypothetical protein E6C27_scaffold335G00170 [Cucumis melo var. makuwa]|uniref:NBS-LRR type resistance protein n=1 Tax=Cucumis melo var. makuwa TaxID=1194695 RepID=A0A5A7TJC3_CUCMM|nr:hypothetical protein E6C27_scaffold335G00170 [Cucumis melo var. makuwa]